MAGRLSRREALTGWAFASPWLLGMVLFVAGPVVASLVISFLEGNLLESARWVGWANYRRLVAEDPLFFNELRATVIYTAVAVPLGMALLLATDLVPPAAVVVTGLTLFGILFAINSSLHSYLIVAYAAEDGVSLDVGFYYMANAMGRLIGTVLSGWIFQTWGLAACLWLSSAFVLLAALISLGLPRHRA